MYAQRGLGAAKTSAYYAVAPFIGVALSFSFSGELPGPLFFLRPGDHDRGTWLVNRARDKGMRKNRTAGNVRGLRGPSLRVARLGPGLIPANCRSGSNNNLRLNLKASR